MPRLGVRKDAAYKAVGTAPSINKTPVGAAVVPVAYPVQHDLSNSVGNAATVRFNGDPAHKLDASSQTSTLGDAPGTAGGVRSGTVGGEVKPTGASHTVRVEGKPLVRDGDPCTLNGGNCPGVYVAGGGPGGKVEAARPAHDPDPPAKLKPAEQKAWYQKVGDWVGEQAHNAGQAVMHPGEGLKGAAKGLANIPGDVWNLVAMGATAQAGGEMMNSAAMQSAFGGGSAADAEAQFKLGSQLATSPGAYAPTVPQAFTMSNAAQEGGDLIATLIPTPKGLVEGVGKLGAKMAGKEAAKVAEKEAAKLAAKEAEKAAAKKAEEEAARAAEKKAGDAPEGPGDGAKVKPSPRGGPCDHLKKGDSQGAGQYRGGSYGGTTAPGIESHHMPANSVSPLAKSQGPAIQMDRSDHVLTASHGHQGADGAAYRAEIKALLDQGRWRDVVAAEAKDARAVAQATGNPSKYNTAIKEMLAYFKCLGSHGLLR